MAGEREVTGRRSAVDIWKITGEHVTAGGKTPEFVERFESCVILFLDVLLKKRKKKKKKKTKTCL